MNAAKPMPTADELQRQWLEAPRWRGVRRTYDAKDVVRLRGTVAWSTRSRGSPRTNCGLPERAAIRERTGALTEIRPCSR